MVHLARRKIKGNVYLYLQENQRVDGKVKRVWQHYLGPESTIKDHISAISDSNFTITNFDFGLP
nr:hypothetical protein [Candidatus Sigynarchaeum springense]